MAEESLLDEHGVLARVTAAGDPPRFRLLHYIDAYGETVFNGLQAPDLVADIADLAMDASDDTAPFFAELLRLAQRVADEVHLYLRFSGD